VSNQHREYQFQSPGNLNLEPEKYLIDKDTFFTLGFTKGFWFGGFDPSGNLALTATGYQDSDLGMGPIYNSSGLDDIELCRFFNKEWQIRKIEVESLRAAFSSNSLTVDIIPQDILEWPALGNPWIGEFAPQYDMAPFYDLNLDGIYNPLDGDYPIALIENPEFIPYLFTFSVNNDNVPHSESESTTITIENHLLSYLVNCEEEQESNHTIFTRLKTIYKGLYDMKNFKISLWQDFDLGCIDDDLVGSDPPLNAVFTYNEFGQDNQDCFFPGTIVPEEGAAVYSSILLNNDIQSFMSYDNGAFTTFIQGIDPSSPLEYYNYMTAQWRDGTKLTTGGNGYNPNSINTTQFAYPNLPNDPSGWSMQSANISFGDRRTVTTLFSQDIQPGEIIVLDMAEHVFYTEEVNDLSVFDSWPAAIQKLKEEYNKQINGNYDCQDFMTSTSKKLINLSTLKIYPNPSSDFVTIEFDQLHKGTLFVYNSEMKLIKSELIKGADKIKLATQDFTQGIYYLTVVNNEGKIAREKFIKI